MEASRDELLKAIKLADEAGDRNAVEDIASMLDSMSAGEVPIDPNVMVDSQQRRQNEMGFGDFMGQAAKTGATESVAGLTAIAQAGYDKLTGSSDFLPALGQHFVENQAAAQKLLVDAGIFSPEQYSPQEMRAADPSGGYLYAGAKALTDPLAITAPLLKGATTLAKGGSVLSSVAPVTARAIESGIAGTAGELGGTVGEQLGGPEGGLIGSVVAGAVAPSLTAPVRSAIGEGVVEGVSKGLEIKKAAKSGEAASTYSSKAANNLLKDISDEAGGVEQIESILENYEKISGIVGKKDFPLIVSMANNKTLRSKFNEVARGAKGAQLRAKMQSELDKLKIAINEKSDILFGSRDFSPVNMEVNLELKKRADDALKKAASIEGRIASYSDPFKEASKVDTGKAVKNLINAKSDSVRASLSPQYQEVINAATDAGAKMPSEGTQAIYEFVVQNNMRDIFGRTTEADRKVMSILKPKKVKKAADEGLTQRELLRKTPEEITVDSFPEISFENVDSLKKLINKIQRENKTDSEVYRKISQLEQVVDNQRDLIPGDFNQRLRQVDAAYYQQMGIPFDNKSIKDLNTKGYVEQVAPLLLSKPSAAKQFIETVGAEGVPVLKTTLLSKMYDSAILPDGSINQRAFEKAIKDNAEFIDLVPGLGDELTSMAIRNSDDIIAHKAAIDQVNLAEADVKAAQILANDPALGVTFKEVATSLDDPAKLAKFNDKVSKLDPSSQALLNSRLQREVIAQALKRPNSVEYLTDPNNSAVLARVMGNQYTEDLKAFAELSDMMKQIDLNNVTPFPGQSDLDPLQRTIGVPTQGVTSVLRDRIMSGTQKVVVLLAKANTSRIKNAQDNALMEVFLDPEGLRKLAKVAASNKKPTDLGINKQVAKVLNIVKGRLPQYTVSAMSREVARQEDQKFYEEQERRRKEAMATLPPGYDPLEVQVTQGM